jgi:Fe-Mn family superoxide dismutase
MYVTNLNAALKDHGQLSALPLPELLAQLGEIQDSICPAVRNKAGGPANHSMCWTWMGGNGGAPSGELAAAIGRDLGGVGKLKIDFDRAALGVFGSGWVMVTVDQAGKLGLTRAH